MERQDRLILKRLYPTLRSSLSCDGDLLADMHGAGLLSSDDMRHITTGHYGVPREPQQKSEALLQLLPSLGRSAFGEFHRALSRSLAQRNRDLAEELWTAKHGTHVTQPDRSRSAERAGIAETRAEEQPPPPPHTASLVAALRSTAWTPEHSDVLMAELSPEDLRQLSRRLLQVFPVQCTDTGGRGQNTPVVMSESTHRAR
ncbi:uncharacterized protein LOC135825821 [Sycon ciliatum]|uniref:uncharacterized protein LOC135825821 n=1 Tax=Sycon ciliatum TaxID=27933 RepID=UPI0020ADFE2A|eukprot:scpid95939/ scgid27744/ 